MCFLIVLQHGPCRGLFLLCLLSMLGLTKDTLLYLSAQSGALPEESRTMQENIEPWPFLRRTHPRKKPDIITELSTRKVNRGAHVTVT